MRGSARRGLERAVPRRAAVNPLRCALPGTRKPRVAILGAPSEAYAFQTPRPAWAVLVSPRSRAQLRRSRQAHFCADTPDMIHAFVARVRHSRPHA
jgi:hypothetical protein